MLEKKQIAMRMNAALGLMDDGPIKEENVALIPSDGCPGHMGSGPWDVYAARAGEFTILAYVYLMEEEPDINIVVV